MWRLAIAAVAGLGLLSGSALAQTNDTYANTEGGIFLASALNIAQSPISQMETLGTGSSYGTAYGFDLGNGFKTEIEGLSSPVPRATRAWAVLRRTAISRARA